MNWTAALEKEKLFVFQILLFHIVILAFHEKPRILLLKFMSVQKNLTKILIVH